jgi:hypothetical protein
MSLRNRLRRLEERTPEQPGDSDEVVIVLPSNGRGGPMKLPRRSGNIVIYDAKKGIPENWREIESD